eukprot:scaffold96529_cov69-Phaeocystis_antarctica.AAC.1
MATGCAERVQEGLQRVAQYVQRRVLVLRARVARRVRLRRWGRWLGCRASGEERKRARGRAWRARLGDAEWVERDEAVAAGEALRVGGHIAHVRGERLLRQAALRTRHATSLASGGAEAVDAREQVGDLRRARGVRVRGQGQGR